jgi:hypothetical protein
MVGGDSLQTANGNGFFFDAAASAGRLTRAVADSTENAGENVGFSIHQVGTGEFALSNQPNVFRNIGMCRTSPLAVYDAMKIIAFQRIGRFHVISTWPTPL